MPLKISVLAGAFLALFGCTHDLSRRTDDQAWKDYESEVHSARAPASVDPASELHEALNNISARNLLLSCQSGENTQSCFQTKLSLAFDEAFRNWQKKAEKGSPRGDSTYKAEQQAFFSTHSFDETFSDVQTFHQRLLSGMDSLAIDHVKKLNEECAQELGSEVAVRAYFPFNGGVGELPKAQLNCLNEKWFADMESLLSETTQKLNLTIQSENAKAWIKKYQIHPLYLQETNQFLRHTQDEEQKQWDEVEVAKIQHPSLKDVPQYRKTYPHLPVEALLTALRQKEKVK